MTTVGDGRQTGELRTVELRHRVFVTLVLVSVFAFWAWFAFVYTWPMASNPGID